MMALVSTSLRAPRLSSTHCSVGPLHISMTRCTTPAARGVWGGCRACAEQGLCRGLCRGMCRAGMQRRVQSARV